MCDKISYCIPPKCPTVSKKLGKNVPELHLAAIFCENKSETVAKHRINQSKNCPFVAGNTQNGGFWKKMEIFVFFGALGAFRPPNSASYFWASPITTA